MYMNEYPRFVIEMYNSGNPLNVLIRAHHRAKKIRSILLKTESKYPL